MGQLVHFIWSVWVLLASPLLVLFLAATAHAVATQLEMSGFAPGEPIVLTKDDDPKVRIEGQAGQKGTFTFDLSKYNLPAGSHVRVTRIGGDSKIIPALRDGRNERDWSNPEREAFRSPFYDWSATAQVGYGGRTTGRSGIGTIVGSDEFIVKSANWVSGVVPQVNVTGALFEKQIDLGLSGFFGHDKNSGGEAVGERTIGIVFDKTFAGSPGIGLANTGASVSSKVDISAIEAALAIPDLFFKTEIRPKVDVKFGSRVVVGYDNTDYRNHFQSSTFPGIFANSRREVNNTYGGPGVTLQKTHKLTDQVEFYAGINLDAIYSSGDYDGRQSTSCNLCPPGLTDVRIRTSDHKSSWSARPAVAAGLEYEFNNASVGFNAGYEYWSHFLVLRDRSSPSESAPGLDTKGVHRLKTGFFLKYTF